VDRPGEGREQLELTEVPPTYLGLFVKTLLIVDIGTGTNVSSHWDMDGTPGLVARTSGTKSAGNGPMLSRMAL